MAFSSGAGFFPPASLVAALALGAIGTVEGQMDEKTIQNDGGSAAEVWTVTVGSTTSSTTHSFDIYPLGSPGSKQTVTYASADSNTTNAATGLKEYFTDTTLTAYGLASVSQSTNVLTFTGRISGVAIVIDNASNVTLSNSTDAADAERVGPGLCMIRTGYDSTTNRTKGRKAVSSAFTAMSVAFAIANLSAASELIATIRFAGRTINARAVFNSDSDTTVSDLATNIDTKMDAAFGTAQSVDASAASGTLTLASDVAGSVWYCDVQVINDTNATIARTDTGGPDDPAYSLPAAFVGISKFSSNMRPSTLGGIDAGVEPLEGVCVVTGGPGFVYVDLNSLTITSSDRPWVDLTTGSSGRAEFYDGASASSARVPLWHPDMGWMAAYVGKGGDGATAMRVLKTIAA
jgi:hypothetical protein